MSPSNCDLRYVCRVGRNRIVAWVVSVSGLALIAVLVCGISLYNTIEPRGIVIHHSAVPMSLNRGPIDRTTLDAIHARRGFRAFYWGKVYHVGYHYVILPDGTVQAGRPEHLRGAHASGYNSFIGVCLVGDFSHSDNPDGRYGPVEPAKAQMTALRELCLRLERKYEIPPDHIFQHRDLDRHTQCPGDRFPWRTFITEVRTNQLERAQPELRKEESAK